jgi:pimeloyl-ACP methyl ester carboxylesterase
LATFLLVHGGGHGGWCYQRLAALLRAVGHEVYAPTLTGLGERVHLLSPEVSLDTHITDITNVITYEDLRQVVLVGHSYAGMVITGVADRVMQQSPSRLSWLVYLDAAIPVNQESLVDCSPGIRLFAETDMKRVNDVDLVLWPGPVTQQIYGVYDADWEWMQPKLTPHPWRTFVDPLMLVDEAAVQRIPRAIINCKATLDRRPESRRARYGQGERVWQLDNAAHDVMITQPHRLAELLLELA